MLMDSGVFRSILPAAIVRERKLRTRAAPDGVYLVPQGSAEAPAHARCIPQRPTGGAAHSRLRTVVLNAALRENLVEVLSIAGHQAIGPENGARALELLREMQAKPAVIVLDLIMPEMSGWRFREALLADPLLSSIPVVCCPPIRIMKPTFPELPSS